MGSEKKCLNRCVRCELNNGNILTVGILSGVIRVRNRRKPPASHTSSLSTSLVPSTPPLPAPKPRKHGFYHPRHRRYCTSDATYLCTSTAVDTTAYSPLIPPRRKSKSRQVPQPPFHCFLTLAELLQLFVCPAFALAGNTSPDAPLSARTGQETLCGVTSRKTAPLKPALQKHASKMTAVSFALNCARPSN